MSFKQNRDSFYIDFNLTSGELINKSKLSFGKCFDCGKERSNVGWCKDCEINAFKENFKNWTSGNPNIDDLEYIDFEQFDLIENINKGGAFSAIYSAIWIEGPRWIWDEDAEQWTRNGPIKVALKRLNNSHNISEEYLNQVSLNLKYITIFPKDLLITFCLINFK